MKFLEAINKAMLGMKIRRPTFNKENYLYFKDNVLMSSITKERAYLVKNHFTADDWEIVEDKINLSDRIIIINICDELSHIPIQEIKQTIVKELKKSLKEYFDWEDEGIQDYVNKMARNKKRSEIFGDKLVQ